LFRISSPDELKPFLKDIWEQAGMSWSSSDLIEVRSVAGGDINTAFKVKTKEGSWFIKTNRADQMPGMFEAEEKGLRLLQTHFPGKVPEVYRHGRSGSCSWLLLEWIVSENRSASFWEKFGIALAEMHKVSNPFFGLDHDNYMGSLPQSNTKASSWSEFFALQRLIPQWQLAKKDLQLAYLLDCQAEKNFDSILNRLDDLVPETSPSLVHGDLWSGNFMVGLSSTPVLVDPAAHYGHPETDLAMSMLFGGFSAEFYTAYTAHSNMSPGFPERADIFNLYPLLIHLNLFGGSYAGQVLNILNRLA
jgi:protein-ribulosamine 3-kinase